VAVELYQFAISHYCEKVRWALEYKNVRYRSIWLMPGLHIKTVRQFAPRSSVPVLVENNLAIQGSREILDWLEQQHPIPALGSDQTAIAEQISDWETRLDDELGPAIRLYAYHYMLPHPKLTVPLLGAHQGLVKRWMLKLGYSRVEEQMRQWMKINDNTARRAETAINDCLNDLASVYRNQEFLVGDQFSRADLTAAALVAPMFQPKQYPVKWAPLSAMPAPLQQLRENHSELIGKLEQFYQRYRSPND